ncbi:secretion system protein E, partial [Archaeoglobales archaeon]
STVFSWDSVRDEHVMIGTSKALEEIRKQRGWSGKELREELEMRQTILEYMAEYNIRNFRDVSNIIHAYQTDPDKAMNLIGLKEWM